MTDERLFRAQRQQKSLEGNILMAFLLIQWQWLEDCPIFSECEGNIDYEV